MTKVELKKLAKDQLQYNLGFSPAINNIVLLEYGATSNSVYDVDYLLFRVRGVNSFEYRLSRNWLKHNYYEMTIIDSNDRYSNEFEISTNR